MEESYLYERGAQANQVPTQKSKVLSEAGRKWKQIDSYG